MKKHYQIDPANSWMVAAAEKNLPIIVPGWEDSTLGNIFAARCMEGKVSRSAMKMGIDYMHPRLWPYNVGLLGVFVHTKSFHCLAGQKE